MTLLITLRGKGRDDYPIRAMWNSLIAGVVFEHKSCESLRRELSRNAQLRELCGFSVFSTVPSKSAYSRFLVNLLKHQNYVEQIFDRLVKDLLTHLPDYGKHLAIDGKALQSFARNPGGFTNDRRGDHEANWGVKTYKGTHKNGMHWEKMSTWFGYKLHLICDAKYELPVHFKVAQASTSEVKVAHELFDELNHKHPTLVRRAEYAMGDRGLDSTHQRTLATLYDQTDYCGPFYVAGQRTQ